MEDYGKAKYRYFFLSFSVAFFILSLMFLFLMSVMHPKIPESLLREPEIGTIADTYIPEEDDAITVLFFGVTDDESISENFVLVRFDPAHGKVPVIVFPTMTATDNDGKIEPLSEVFRYGGADYTRNALAKTLGIPIDRYVRIRWDAFITGAAAIGSVEFDLPEDVTITRGGAPVTLSRGKQLLDGQKAVDLIRYGSYSGGETERCRVAGELTAAIVNQRMDICLTTVIDSVFEKIINMISTDISYTDYHDRKPAAEFLARVGKNPAYIITPTGVWNSDKTLFTLSDTFLAHISQEMR